MIVRFTPAAEADVIRAVEWYEGQREGLGLEFFARVDEAVQRVGSNPLAYRKVFGEARRINLRQFPFGLWYKVEQDAIVIACLHAKRSTALARERAIGIIELPKPPEPAS